MKIKSSVTSYLVPTSSIVTSTEGKYVVSIKDGRTKYINIKEGIASNGKTEVFGEFEGDEVVMKKPSGETKEGISY